MYFLVGNIHFLKNDFKQSKDMYRQVLKMSPQPKLEAHILNNLAFASWMHVMEIPKIKRELLGPEP